VIQFVSEPKDVAALNLVGRIVVQGVIPGWPAFRHPAKVIEASDTVVLTARLDANYSDEEGMWLFTDRETRDRQVVRLEDIRAVCDCAHEANRLIRKSRDAIRAYEDTRGRICNEFLKLADDIIDGTGAPQAEVMQFGDHC
jgi:hypothetical protein